MKEKYGNRMKLEKIFQALLFLADINLLINTYHISYLRKIPHPVSKKMAI